MTPNNPESERDASPSDVKIVREWDADAFHGRVSELEALGYIARLETYQVVPEMNPETGEISHVYLIEMMLPDSGANPVQTKPSPPR